MCVNAGLGCLYAVLLALTCCRGPRLPGQRLLRPECRVWLAFLALTYIGASLGYLLFLAFAIPATTAMWLGEVFLYLYALGFGPALYLTFRRERRYWLAGGSEGREARRSANERLLNVAVAGPSVQPSPAPKRFSTSPTLQAPPGGFAAGYGQDGASMLRAALRGVRIVQPEELSMHELIGSGGFAEVFRATWTDRAAGSEMQVAAKQPRSLPREAHGLHSFCRECALMQRLKHPNVLPLLGVTVSPSGTVAVLTAYMPRGSVFGMLHPRNGRGTPLPRVLAMRMLADCARGVGYLHGCSPPIIHRDLKSQNLLVGADYSVKVADFGLSRECLQPGAMTRVGSVQWAAPEVLLGKSYSHKCDLWSFGVVCWEVLTARVPFDGMAPTTVATKVAMEGLRLPVPPQAPMRLLRLIARCWSEDPEQRPSFEAVVTELGAIEVALTAEAPRSSDAPTRPASSTQ